MQVFFLRHAQKNSNIELDPGLSVVGHKQAQILTDQLKDKLTGHTQLWSSGKKRTEQTLMPLSLALQCPIKVVDELLERQNQEKQIDFSHRVGKWILQTTQVPPLCDQVVVCTHLDVLEEILNSLPMNVSIEDPRLPRFWPQAYYLSFELRDGLWHLMEQGGFDEHHS